jgi:hypothetical protein
MILSVGESPFSSKYIESPSFEKDSIPADGNHNISKQTISSKIIGTPILTDIK